MRRALLAVLLTCGTAQAATYYVDKPIPISTAPPCMIDIGNNILINARMIQSIQIDKQARTELIERNAFKDHVWRHTPGITIQLPTQKFVVGLGETGDRVQHRLQGILGLIADCK